MSLLDFFRDKKNQNLNEEKLFEENNTKQLINALKDVIDPETGIDIISLGLIYGIIINDSNIEIQMTMTTSSCPLISLLVDLSKEKIESLVWVKSVNIELIWEPKWDISMMSEDAKEQLGW
jgi:metal-sulfur cluster biosynthetic enzyme